MRVLIATEKPFAPAAVNGIREIVETAGHELILLEKYTSRINANLDSLYLSVGGKEPSEIAVKFGALSSAVGLLLELLDSKTKLKVKSPEKISVVCDYLSSDIKFSIDVTVKIRILDVVKTGIEILVLMLKRGVIKK